MLHNMPVKGGEVTVLHEAVHSGWTASEVVPEKRLADAPTSTLFDQQHHNIGTLRNTAHT